MSVDIVDALATGGAAGVITLGLWVKYLIAKLESAERKYEDISREAIECLAKIVEREDGNKDWRDRVVHLLETIKSQRSE